MQEQEFDLASLDTRKGSDEGFELQLTSPKDGSPLPIVIFLYGPDSAVYQDIVRAQARKRAQDIRRTGKLKLNPDDVEADSMEILVGVTKGWKSFRLDGQDFSFSPESTRKLYERFPWIRDQVNSAAGDRANFLPANSKI